MGAVDQEIVVITGATGNLGRSLAEDFASDYQIVGFDRTPKDAGFPVIAADFSQDASVELALARFREAFGVRIASVIHLVAYFDFTGEDNPLYREVNVDGTTRLLRGLQAFDVEQFVYASTMLVHAPCRPGERLDESQPIDPRWAYPNSKAAAEEAIRTGHGRIPYAILRLAGVYDEHSTVPPMAQQIVRIYERSMKSYFYSGSPLVGQAMLHRRDMVAAFRRTIERRAELPPETAMLIGEPDAMGYDAVQDELGSLIHGQEEWPTVRLPKPLATVGAWAEAQLEPVVPDILDQGEEPFIKPFMVEMADDHYALDVTRARTLLDWEPRHRLKDELPAMVAELKRDPAGWYEHNGIKPPHWITEATEMHRDADGLRERYEAQLRREHADNRWAHFINIALGTWLLTQPPLIDVHEAWLRWSEIGLGAGLIVFAALALSWRAQWARWICAGIGALVMAVPFVFWTGNATAYLSDTLVGALIFGFAVCTKPEPGPSAIAALTGPEVPPGWSYNPSAWTQRAPIILLALVGLYVSRYLAGYQLGYIPEVWDPFFDGLATDPQNGTEEVITSSVSKAWPVSDAAIGGYTYLLEILTGLVGSRLRWRTMPWLVVLFGLMIAPLGIISISFIIIQPIVIGTWSAVALVGAAAVLVQIPYSLDELLATLQFLRRRAKAGESVLRVLIFGDTDDGKRSVALEGEFDRSPGAVIKDMVGGGVGLPWNLALAVPVGLWLLFTRVTVGAEGGMADADHLIGSLSLAVISISAAEVARTVRFLNVPLGVALLVTPFVYNADPPVMVASLLCGTALIVLSLRRGPIRQRYGTWKLLI